MSCQQASRVQEDPYAFTEPAPLPANTSLYKQHPAAVSSSGTTGTTSVTTAPPVIQAGASLLTSNNVARVVGGGQQVVGQHRTIVGTSKVAPIKVTLVQSPSGVLSKARLNGATITNSPAGTVFRTVSVPHATTIVQRPAGTVPGTSAASPTVFTKPMQVQISPQQAGKLAASRRVLASKSPNVSPAGTAIQTVRIVKTTTSPQQIQLQQQQQKQLPPGGRPSITPDARRYLNHSSNSLLGPAPTSVATTTPVSQPHIPAISPTKIRLIQPQSQGKIFLHTPNSSNSLATATHISNPVSIAALRSTLAKQNPSLLAKIPQNTTAAVSQATSTVLPTAKATVTPSPTTASINIRRAPIRQTSLETATTTVAPPPIPASTVPQPVLGQPIPTVSTAQPLIPTTTTAPKPTVHIPQTMITQRSRTPTQSLLKPQPPKPVPTIPLQDDIGFTIPSFIIPKQKDPKPEPVSPPTPEAKPSLLTSAVSPSPFQSPTLPAPSAVSTPTTALTPTVPSNKPHGKTKDTSSGKQQQGTKRNKRSYSRSSHHETLERISAGQAIKDDPESGNDSTGKQPVPPQPSPVRFPKWKPPGAVVVPLRRTWHAPDSYIFDICAPGSAEYDSLELAPCTQDFWFEELYASNELDAEDAATALGTGMRPRKNRKGQEEPPQAKLHLNLDGDDGGELKLLDRDDRLELKRAYLRRKAVQSWNGQRLRSVEPARKRLKTTEKLLGKLDRQREVMLQRNGGIQQPRCQRVGCENPALVATSHCYQHITDNTEQRLFQQCTAKFSDNSQCRVPVFDISHELILCREHAWKHDNHDKMSAEVKLLKKPGAIVGVGPKKQPKTPKTPTIKFIPAPVITSAGGKVTKNKKKKKLTPFQQQMALHQQQYKQQYSSVLLKPVTTVLPPPYSQKPVTAPQQSLIRPQIKSNNAMNPVQIVPPSPPTINRNIHIPLNHQPQRPQMPQQTPIGHHQQPQLQHLITHNDDLMLNYTVTGQQQQVQQILGTTTQDLLNICENSSAYASSEDTGVGGLSESELMAAHDVIAEEIPFEIGTLNNVLSQLPPDAFNELLFSGE